MNQAIATILNYGHQFNPTIRKRFEGWTADQFAAITPESELGGALIASYQQFMFPEHAALCQKFHGRQPHFDGELGPATNAVIELDRCGCADFMPIAEEATGSGSWRPGCVAAYPKIHAIYYSLDQSRMGTSWKSWWPEIEQRVHNAYAEIGMLLVKTESAGSAQVNVSAQVLGGSTIGLAQLPPLSAAQACSRGFFCKLDPGYAPNALQVSTLWAHELGHNMGSGHISGDKIMHPSIQSGWNGSFKGLAFGDRLSAWFGGERVGPDTPPTPPSASLRLNITATDPRTDVVYSGVLFGLQTKKD